MRGKKRRSPAEGAAERNAMKENRPAEGHILRLLKKGRRSLLGVVFSRTGLVTLALLANLFLLGLLVVVSREKPAVFAWL